MIIAELHQAITSRTPVVMATVVDSDRSVPRRPGSKMLVYAGGRISGSIGGGEMEARVIEAALELLETGPPRRITYSLLDPTDGDPGVCGGTVELYLEPHLPQTSLLVIGSGELHDAVAELADWLGFGVLAHSAGRAPDEPIDRYTRVILFAEEVDPAADTLRDLLATPAPYVAVVGGSGAGEDARARLLRAGVGTADLDRVHSPVGSDTAGRTAQELALSILVDVIAFERGT